VSGVQHDVRERLRTPVEEPAPPVPVVAGPGLIGHLARSSADDRKAAVETLHATIGNRRVAMMIARTPGPSVPALSPAALEVLKGMGLPEGKIDAFKRGEPVLYERAVPGRPSTLAIVQQKPGLVRGGIFSIDIRANPTAALKEFMGFRQPILNLARAMNVPEMELFGAAVHNEQVLKMLDKQGFVPSKEIIPESFGLGPAEEVTVYSKRFPVQGTTGAGGGTTGGTPPPTTGGTPPPTGGTPPPATTAKPPATTTAKPPTTTGGKAPTTAEAPTAGVRGGLAVRGLKIGAGLGIQTLVFWWLGKKSAEAEERNRATLLRNNVEPHVNKLLKAQSATALKLTAENPSAPVYANVTADFDYTWTVTGIAANKSIENVTDIRFQGMTISHDKLNKEQLLSEEDSGGGQVTTHWATRRITYSVQIDFGETEAEHHWRELLHDAGQTARRKVPARVVGEGQHWAGKDLKGWERRDDNERRKWGLATLEEQRAYEERELWVQAYIEYVAFIGPDDQYLPAIAYLKEIQARPKPVAGKPIRLRMK
jgi:hypothetical protein